MSQSKQTHKYATETEYVEVTIVSLEKLSEGFIIQQTIDALNKRYVELFDTPYLPYKPE